MVKAEQAEYRGRKTEERLKRNRWYRAAQLIVITLALLLSSSSSLSIPSNTKKEPNELIMQYEGFRPKPYRCAGGGLTIGYGTRITDRNMVVTETEAQDLMEAHLDKYVRPHIPNIPLTKRQTVALESLVYNIGATQWNHSKLKTCVEANNTACIKKEWLRWVYVANKKNSWQQQRRKAELAYYIDTITESK